MFIVTVLCAMLFQILALHVLRDKNELSRNAAKQLFGGLLLAVSFAVVIFEFGALAGGFIAIALISLVGMLYPFVFSSAKPKVL